MLTATHKRLFVPNAIYIPTKDGREGRNVDRTDCELLMVDGEFSYGEVFSEEAWKSDGEPSYIQRRGDFYLPDESEIAEGRVQLLPDVCVVKIPDREYWCDDVQAKTKRCSPFTPWTDGSTSISAKCVRPTNCGSSSISMSRPMMWTKMTTSGRN